jgi:hypothetical protein
VFCGRWAPRGQSAGERVVILPIVIFGEDSLRTGHIQEAKASAVIGNIGSGMCNLDQLRLDPQKSLRAQMRASRRRRQHIRRECSEIQWQDSNMVQSASGAINRFQHPLRNLSQVVKSRRVRLETSWRNQSEANPLPRGSALRRYFIHAVVSTIIKHVSKRFLTSDA